MMILALTSAFLTLGAGSGLPQEPGVPLVLEDPSSPSAEGGLDAERGAASLPLSLSSEAEPSPPGESEFSIGPTAGSLKARGADRGTWSAGAQARLHFLKYFAAEASITFHQDEYQNGDVVVTQYPVQVTGFLYPFPEWEFKPYLLAGAGWYYTRVRYHGLPSLLYQDQTAHSFGGHAGAGVEARLGPSVSIDADVRYIFLNPEADALRSGDFDYWQFTAGINFFF
jgi:hypothetical protein